MATTTPDQTQPIHLGTGGEPTLRKCIRCNLTYTPTKSTSELRLTYCSFLCELGDLGFSMAGLEHMERAKKDIEPEAEPEPVAAE